MQDNLQNLFRGLADPVRRQIILWLRDEPQSISSLVDKVDLSRNAVVKHLKVLEDADLVFGKHLGRQRINHLKPESLQPAQAWLASFDTFWDDKLAKLKDTIEE
ncbi:MAG: metalloregulator ArsR/SmtB family transcription factor [Congregibacter sp.]